MGGSNRLPRGCLRRGSAIDLSHVPSDTIDWNGLSARLAEDQGIKSLYLIGTLIAMREAKGIASLVKNSHLNHLHLSQNECEGAALRTITASLRDSATILKLTLMNNCIGDAGVIAIARALENNTALVDLDISDTKFGDSGAAALAKLLRKGSNLRRLVISDNQISDTAQKRLKSAAEIIEDFTLVGITENSRDANSTFTDSAHRRQGENRER